MIYSKIPSNQARLEYWLSHDRNGGRTTLRGLPLGGMEHFAIYAMMNKIPKSVYNNDFKNFREISPYIWHVLILLAYALTELHGKLSINLKIKTIN